MPSFGELQAATSLRRVIPQVFATFASVCAVVVVAAALIDTPTPSSLVAAGLRWLGAPVPGPLIAITGWLAARAEVATTLTAVTMVLALWWSGTLVAKGWTRRYEARGPSTFWVGVAVLAEVHGRTAVLKAVVVAGAVLLFVAIASSVRTRHATPHARGVGPAGDAAGALGAGLVVVVPCYLLLLIGHALGGLPRSRESRAPSPGDEDVTTMRAAHL